MTVALVAFRRDLRLADNPALRAACETGSAVVPVFIWAPEEEGAWAPGSASRWWLGRSLGALEAALRARGSRLILAPGPTLERLQSLAREARATRIFWNRRFEPAAKRRDAQVACELGRLGIDVSETNASLLFEPERVHSAEGRPYQVFTAFWRACLKRLPVSFPVAPPAHLKTPPVWPAGRTLEDLGLAEEPRWASGLDRAWDPGEGGAQRALLRFVDRGLRDYPAGRERPDREGTSRLSPHLRFGEIGPRQVWHAIEGAAAQRRAGAEWPAIEALERQLGWREFAAHVLFHFPHTPERPLRAGRTRLRWRRDESAKRAWQRGLTGFPIVDAGMRQLWTTGWMHNRVRMIAASFLVKDLLLPWPLGARWFWDTLVDADLANNTLGWQWAAGCGADAAPFFRVFNPVLQGKKFDPEGRYVRLFVPELARLDTRWVHEPWRAPANILAQAGIELGRTYPRPIVDHAKARARALAALVSRRTAPRV
jgi:deoxyribodipyrimidine photo-lyase